jgi:hypothetical protein
MKSASLRIKEQVGELVSIGMPTVCLKTRPPNNKYVVNQKLNHFDDISVRELCGRIRVLFFTK